MFRFMSTKTEAIMMNNRLLIADSMDIISYILLSYVTTTEVLEWVYTILLIISLALGISLKILSALKDRKVSKEEAEEIKRAVDEAKNEVRNEINEKEADDNVHH